MNILELAKRNQQKAWEIIEDTRIVRIWEGMGAKVNLVGSLRTGLLMKHRDIDFHIYTSPLDLSASFRAMAELAENTSVKKIEYTNLLHTAEATSLSKASIPPHPPPGAIFSIPQIPDNYVHHPESQLDNTPLP